MLLYILLLIVNKSHKTNIVLFRLSICSDFPTLYVALRPKPIGFHKKLKSLKTSPKYIIHFVERLISKTAVHSCFWQMSLKLKEIPTCICWGLFFAADLYTFVVLVSIWGRRTVYVGVKINCSVCVFIMMKVKVTQCSSVALRSV